MNRFGYLRDPLFLLAAASYALNRGWFKRLAPAGFFHNHFNDLLLIPAALPVVLWVQRAVGWRRHDDPPSWSEAALHAGVWSVICEFVGPRFLHSGTADVGDLAAYALGGLVACLWWHRAARLPPRDSR